jgi:hypothetical protein
MPAKIHVHGRIFQAWHMTDQPILRFFGDFVSFFTEVPESTFALA